jgi:hypothetical protein
MPTIVSLLDKKYPPKMSGYFTLQTQPRLDPDPSALPHPRHGPHPPRAFRQRAFGDDGDLAAVLWRENVDRFPAFLTPFIQSGLNEFILRTK